jgi:hypothetical protein
MGAERDRVTGFGRLEDGLRQPGTDWYRWGPYVSERQWGTVREDYSADGNAWDYLPVPLQNVVHRLTCRFNGSAHAARWYSLITPPRIFRRCTGASSGTTTGPS